MHKKEDRGGHKITSFADSPSSFYSTSSHFTTDDDDFSCSDRVASPSYPTSHFDTLCPNLTICEGSSSSSSSSSATAAAPPSSSSSNFYEVFLSFRGTDTRDNFALSVVVFSKDYTSSSWCLEELQTIVDFTVRKNKDEKIPHTLLPSCYAKLFAKHHELIPDDKLQIWKSALKTASESSGWDSKNRLVTEPQFSNRNLTRIPRQQAQSLSTLQIISLFLSTNFLYLTFPSSAVILLPTVPRSRPPPPPNSPPVVSTSTPPDFHAQPSVSSAL
ncbi:hypothetical protein LINGRAHAP2_LOCUS1775 [Linum grandiflorum]